MLVKALARVSVKAICLLGMLQLSPIYQNAAHAEGAKYLDEYARLIVGGRENYSGRAIEHLHDYYVFRDASIEHIEKEYFGRKSGYKLPFFIESVTSEIVLGKAMERYIVDRSVKDGHETGNVAALFLARMLAVEKQRGTEFDIDADYVWDPDSSTDPDKFHRDRTFRMIRDVKNAGINLHAAVAFVEENGLFADIDPAVGFGRVESDIPSEPALLSAINRWLTADCSNVGMLEHGNDIAGMAALTGVARVEDGKCHYQNATGVYATFYASGVKYECEPIDRGADCTVTIRMASEMSSKGVLGKMPGLNEMVARMNPLAGMTVGPSQVSLVRTGNGQWVFDESKHGRGPND